MKRLLVNHPTFLIDASLSDINELASDGRDAGAQLVHVGGRAEQERQVHRGGARIR